MAFTEILKDLMRRVEGAEAATLMGMDGIAVATHHASGESSVIEPLGTELGVVASAVRKASESFGLGAVREVSVETAGYRVIVSLFTDDYFIALLLAHGANVGKARYHLAKAGRAALREL